MAGSAGCKHAGLTAVHRCGERGICRGWIGAAKDGSGTCMFRRAHEGSQSRYLGCAFHGRTT